MCRLSFQSELAMSFQLSLGLFKRCFLFMSNNIGYIRYFGDIFSFTSYQNRPLKSYFQQIRMRAEQTIFLIRRVDFYDRGNVIVETLSLLVSIMIYGAV